MRRGAGSLLAAITLVLPTASEAQDKKKFVTNYDEAKVPKFTLPDPLVMVADANPPGRIAWS